MRMLIAASLLASATACSRGSAASDARDSAAATRSDTTQSTATRLPSASQSGGSTDRATGASTGAKRRTILFVGTSLTAGLGLEPDSAYPMQIQRKIDSAGLAFDVTNAGVSGETSAGLLDRLDWLMRGNFSVLVLETGANDGLRGIPTKTLEANLDSAIDRIKAKRPDARLLLVQMEALPNLGPKYAADFHAVYPAVAKAKGVTLLPFLLTGVAGHKELNQGDGVHPNYAGERIVAANLWKALEPILDSIAPRA